MGKFTESSAVVCQPNCNSFASHNKESIGQLSVTVSVACSGWMKHVWWQNCGIMIKAGYRFS
ncbi:hypothetical protein IG631_17645 [Alternaria alternata]|nr:hypothetical protein IG631_17645 [Alternaria alternata]